jgi:uncharacterized protein YgiB involved in biofilm formation
MLKKLRKSSSQVTLVLIGLAGLGGLSGCSQEETRRDVYASKEDCLKDWGNNPADCEPANDRPRTTGGGYHYYGRPYTYFGDSSTTTASGARSTRAVSSSTISRGGFGSSGHSSSSG